MSVNMTVLDTIRRYHNTTRQQTIRTVLNPPEPNEAGTSLMSPSGSAAPAADREAYFQELATEIETYVQQILPGLEGPDQAGETYLAKVGRLNMARAQAEEIALGDLLYPNPTEADEEQDPPSAWSAALSGLRADLDSDRAELNRILLDAKTG